MNPITTNNPTPLHPYTPTPIIGITGGIGSGKSYIAAQMAAAGYRVYNTDKEAKRLIVEDPELRASIVALLGADVYEGDVYRTDIVASRVFANPDLLHQLNALVHPVVQRDIENLINSKLSNETATLNSPLSTLNLIIESALLFESGLDRLCDRVMVVTASEEVRIARTMARDHCTEKQVRDRMAAQMSEKECIFRADFVINNNN